MTTPLNRVCFVVRESETPLRLSDHQRFTSTPILGLGDILEVDSQNQNMTEMKRARRNVTVNPQKLAIGFLSSESHEPLFFVSAVMMRYL